MKDTIDYQHHRIVALQKRVSELELMLLETTDKYCTEEYRLLIREQILNK
jgi:hypothetical protein